MGMYEDVLYRYRVQGRSKRENKAIGDERSEEKKWRGWLSHLRNYMVLGWLISSFSLAITSYMNEDLRRTILWSRSHYDNHHTHLDRISFSLSLLLLFWIEGRVNNKETPPYREYSFQFPSLWEISMLLFLLF